MSEEKSRFELFPDIGDLVNMMEVERLQQKALLWKIHSTSLKSALLSVQADIEEIREMIHPDDDPSYDEIREAFDKLSWLINYIDVVMAQHKNTQRILSKI